MAWAGSEGSSGDGSRHSAAPGPLHAGDQRAPITLRQCFDLVLKVHARCAVDIGRCCAAKRASGTSSCFLAVATLGSALRPGTPRRHVLLLTQRARSRWRPALCLSVPKLRSTTPVPCAQHNTGRTSLLLPCDVRLRGKASLARCCGSGLSAACASSWRDGDHGRSVQPAEAWATAALRTPATAADGHGERAQAAGSGAPAGPWCSRTPGASSSRASAGGCPAYLSACKGQRPACAQPGVGQRGVAFVGLAWPAPESEHDAG